MRHGKINVGQRLSENHDRNHLPDGQDFVTKSSRLSETEKRMFLGETAEKFYGYKHQESIPYTKNMVED